LLRFGDVRRRKMENGEGYSWVDFAGEFEYKGRHIIFRGQALSLWLIRMLRVYHLIFAHIGQFFTKTALAKKMELRRHYGETCLILRLMGAHMPG